MVVGGKGSSQEVDGIGVEKTPLRRDIFILCIRPEMIEMTISAPRLSASRKERDLFSRPNCRFTGRKGGVFSAVSPEQALDIEQRQRGRDETESDVEQVMIM